MTHPIDITTPAAFEQACAEVDSQLGGLDTPSQPDTIDAKAWKELVAMAEKHGGARPGAGRKVLDEKSPTTKYLIAVTVAQREKIDANGGAPWVRGLIDAAPVAKPAKATTPKKP